MNDSDRAWNAAISAAMKAIERAPVFSIRDDGPIVIAEKLRILDICRTQVEKLKRIDKEEAA